jgi:glycosyltransferase involved in cell wall biosynthesis
MKVLHVIPSVASRDGGPAIAVVGMCGALRAAGIDARIATTDADGTARLEVPLERETTFAAIPTTFFARDGATGFKRSARLADWLRGHVGGFDLVHIHAVFSHSSLAASRACRAAGVPYIVRPLGTLDPWSLQQKRWQKRVLMIAGVNRMLTHAAGVHFTTREEKDRAPEIAQTRGFVVPLGLAEEAFGPAQVAYDDRPAHIVTFTRLHPKKNLETLIDAVAALPRAGGWRLTIAGDGDAAYRAALEARAAASAAADRITFAGWVAGAAKDALLADAALFALPSRQENFGLSVLEALAQGTPVAISRAVNLAGDVEAASAGWITEDDDGFVRALASITLDAAGRRDRAGRARVLAERFRWPAVAASLIHVYEALIADRAVVREARVH